MSSIILSPKEAKFLKEHVYKYNQKTTTSQRVSISRMNKRIEKDLFNNMNDFFDDLADISRYYLYKNPDMKKEIIEGLPYFFPLKIAGMLRDWLPHDAQMMCLRHIFDQTDPREIMNIFSHYLNDYEFHDYEDAKEIKSNTILELEDDKRKIVSDIRDFLASTSEKKCIYRYEWPIGFHEHNQKISVAYFVSKEAIEYLSVVDSNLYSGEIKFNPVRVTNRNGQFDVTIIFNINWIKAVLISLLDIDFDGSIAWWDNLERGSYGIMRRGRLLKYQTVVRSQDDIIARVKTIINDLCSYGVPVRSHKLKTIEIIMVKPECSTASIIQSRGRPMKTIGGKEILPYCESASFQIKLEKEIKRSIKGLNDENIIKRKRGIKPSYYIPSKSLKAIRDSGIFHISPDEIDEENEKHMFLFLRPLMINFDNYIKEIDPDKITPS